MENIEIILASYNGEKYIEQQIDSIINNSYDNITIKVVDDCSTDNTSQIVERLAGIHQGKVAFSKNKTNVGVAKNVLNGVRNTKSNYIMLCDQDDVWLSDKIKSTLELMKKYEKKYGKETPIGIFTDAKVVDENLNVISESFHKTSALNTSALGLSRLLMENKIIGCTLMINKAAKDKMAKIPNNLRMHDWWIGLVCAAFGKIGYLNKPTLMYRQHEKNVIGNQKFYINVLNRIKNFGKLRRVLLDTQSQGAEFLKMYRDELPRDCVDILEKFSKLSSGNIIKRRYNMIKYGFYKTGFIRNVAVFILL